MTEAAIGHLATATAEAAAGAVRALTGSDDGIGPVSGRPVHDVEQTVAGIRGPLVLTAVDFTGGVAGGMAFTLEVATARSLAAAMMGGASDGAGDDPLTELELSAVAEAGNQMMAAMAGEVASLIGREVDISVPNTRVVDTLEGEVDPTVVPHVSIASFRVFDGDCRVLGLLPNAFVVQAARALEGLGGVGEVDPAAIDNDALLASVGTMTVRLSARIGTARIPFATITSLGPGSVLELDAEADDPVELCVNGVPVATGRLAVDAEGEWCLRVEAVTPGPPEA